MQALLGNKFIVCGLLAALILIPLEMIGGLVQERQARQAAVEADIARSGTGAQIIAGPVLVLPCTESWSEPVTDWQGKLAYESMKSQDCTQHVLPELLEVDGEIKTDVRSRGIYDVLVYAAGLRVAGHYALPTLPVAGHAGATLQFDPPYLSLGFADPRGIAVAPVVKAGGLDYAFAPGARNVALGTGIHATLTDLPTRDRPLPFELSLRLNGLGQLDFLPLGRQTHVRLKSPWQHPSFVGAYLPASRSVDDEGFTAHWATSFLATNIAEQYDAARSDEHKLNALFANNLGVRLAPAVDVYLKSDRATKYGLLFVGISFVALLLTEVLKKLRIHPVQYGMVAVALAIFFLLVLALSEHLGFLPAYVLASVACVGLLGFYLGHIVREWRLASGFSAVLAALYAMLYGLLSAEDYALLMGSLLVFGFVAATMVLTRRIDWYAVSRANQAKVPV